MRFFYLIVPLLATACSSSPVRETYDLAELLKSSSASDWRTPSEENLLYMKLPKGMVILELAPQFAPKHIVNIKALTKAKYWDGLAILRSQENYVVQWGDPDEKGSKFKKLSKGSKKIKTAIVAEFEHDIKSDIPFNKLPDPDVYADQTGFSYGFPAGRDAETNKTWLLHCYGIVGVGRGNDINGSAATSLYAVIGHSPRHLDRNITLIGKVIKGGEYLSTLPRGHGKLGFYENKSEQTPITWVKLGTDLPAKDRFNKQILRTDTKLFNKLIESRRFRSGSWFHAPAGRVEICNVPIPQRDLP